MPLAYAGRPMLEGSASTLSYCFLEKSVFLASVATIWSTVKPSGIVTTERIRLAGSTSTASADFADICFFSW